MSDTADLVVKYALRLDRLEGRYIAYHTRKSMNTPMLVNIDCILETLLHQFIATTSVSEFAQLNEAICNVETLLDEAEQSVGITKRRETQ